MQFAIFNPGNKPVALNLNIYHRRTTNYQTRAVAPLTARPGKTDVRLPIDQITNVNGSTPALADVTRWFISVDDDQRPTLFFSDVWLAGAAPTEIAPAGGGGATVYKIRGKVGTAEVDLIATPLVTPANSPVVAPAGPTVTVAGDPARVARIHAASMPAITAPVMFDTPAADAIVSALEIFPRTIRGTCWSRIGRCRPIRGG